MRTAHVGEFAEGVGVQLGAQPEQRSHRRRCGRRFALLLRARFLSLVAPSEAKRPDQFQPLALGRMGAHKRLEEDIGVK